MDVIARFLRKHIVGLWLTAGSLFVVVFFHSIHVFDFLELKTVDAAFRLRGPLSGWAARNEIPRDSLDVVLVDIDDETYRLVPWTWPYSRDVWGMVLRNLARAGARVVVFDIQFDAPDAQSEYLKPVSEELRRRGLRGIVPVHADSILAEAIRDVQERGTSVIIAAKTVSEPTSMPPQHIEYPNEVILSAGPETGLVDESQDRDGFSRRYYVFNWLEQEPDKWYLTIGMKAVKEYLNFPRRIELSGDAEAGVINFGPMKIPSYGKSPTFLINYYGPASAAGLRGEEAWKTFNRYPLSSVVDVADVDLKDIDEDSDWMEFFMEDSPMYGLLGESPFKDKIVLIGVSVEVLHDEKRTPFYSFAGQQQLMPGVEVHANAIQTLLDQNFISVFGGEIGWSEKSWLPHTLLIAGLCLLSFVLLAFMNPLAAGLTILLEVLVFLSIALGAFTADSWWLLKALIHNILPSAWLDRMGDWILIKTPGMGESMIIPIVAPMFGVFFTYTSNVLYRFIVEQKDKRFLKETFGTYISPELIDEMYEKKEEPKLGGHSGIKTAYFTDIQSFSGFSEVLTATQLVELLNEYLTVMTDILLEQGGTLDKYEGDAIVAFFGAPIPMEDHAYRACVVALNMQRELAKLRGKWGSDEKWPDLVHQMRMRIGINSGDIVTGNMGSRTRMNFTMMGDVVNTAARLEASAKQYGIYVQITRQTLELAGAHEFEVREIDKVRVVGKTEAVESLELMAMKGALNGQQAEMRDIYSDGLALYRNQEWDKAKKRFAESERLEEKFVNRPTNPSRLYMERCDFFKENSPGDDWDGVWTLTKK